MAVEWKHYNLLVPSARFPPSLVELYLIGFFTHQPDREWEVDLDHLSSLVDNRTRAILVNNPSNPCGSVFSLDHIKAILAVAEKYQVPIIADEVYFDMVFPNSGQTQFTIHWGWFPRY